MGSLLSVQGSRRTAPRQEGTQGSNGPAYPFRIPHGRHIACLSLVPFRHENPPVLREKTSYRTLYVLSPTEPAPPFRAPRNRLSPARHIHAPPLASTTAIHPHARMAFVRPPPILHTFLPRMRTTPFRLKPDSESHRCHRHTGTPGFAVRRSHRVLEADRFSIQHPFSFPVFLPTASDSQNDFPNDIFCANDNLTIIRSGTS